MPRRKGADHPAKFAVVVVSNVPTREALIARAAGEYRVGTHSTFDAAAASILAEYYGPSALKLTGPKLDNKRKHLAQAISKFIHPISVS